jgi:hypothetical protein
MNEPHHRQDRYDPAQRDQVRNRGERILHVGETLLKQMTIHAHLGERLLAIEPELTGFSGGGNMTAILALSQAALLLTGWRENGHS